MSLEFEVEDLINKKRLGSAIKLIAVALRQIDTKIEETDRPDREITHAKMDKLSDRLKTLEDSMEKLFND